VQPHFFTKVFEMITEEFDLNENLGVILIVMTDNNGRGLWASVRQDDESEEIHKGHHAPLPEWER
jgi:hypothetical protein